MPDGTQMKLLINVQPSPEGSNYQVVVFEGNLDKFGLETVQDTIEALVNKFDKTYLVFDFTKLNFINSESIGFLLTIHSHMVKAEKFLVVVNAPDNVKDVLGVIGMLKIIKYFDSLADFEQSLKQ